MNQIGVFRFITISGPPFHVVAPQTLPLVRPGVDGAGFVNLGTRGTPFSVVTVVDTTSYTAAVQGMYLYSQIIGSVQRPYVVGGVNMTGNNFAIVVLSVEPLDIRATGGGIGGLATGGTGLLIAEWTLWPISISQDSD